MAISGVVRDAQIRMSLSPDRRVVAYTQAHRTDDLHGSTDGATSRSAARDLLRALDIGVRDVKRA